MNNLSEFSHTVREARRFVRKAKKCAVWVIINSDVGISVEVSKSALAHMDPNDPCGGIYWPKEGEFRLDSV